MRLFVLAALAAALVLAESAAVEKKGLDATKVQELLHLSAAHDKAAGNGDQKKRQPEEKRDDEGDDDYDLDIKIVFCPNYKAFIGIVLDPEEAVWVVNEALKYGGCLDEECHDNVWAMAAYFIEGENQWMMGYYGTIENSIRMVSWWNDQWPPACVDFWEGCDISAYYREMEEHEDGHPVSGHGMWMGHAIEIVDKHLDKDENGDPIGLNVDAILDEVKQEGDEASGRMVSYEDGVAGVCNALGEDCSAFKKKSLEMSKKDSDVAELLQKLREYVRELDKTKTA